MEHLLFADEKFKRRRKYNRQPAQQPDRKTEKAPKNKQREKEKKAATDGASCVRTSCKLKHYKDPEKKAETSFGVQK